MNLWRESATASASVDQEVVQVQPQTNVVLPPTSEGVRNSRKRFKKCLWLDLQRKACRPLSRSRHLQVKWLQPSSQVFRRRSHWGSPVSIAGVGIWELWTNER